MAGRGIEDGLRLPERSERALGRLAHPRERTLSSALDLDDFQRLGKPKLPKAVYGYVDNGADAMVARVNDMGEPA